MIGPEPELHSIEFGAGMLAVAAAKGSDFAAGLRLARQAAEFARREEAGDEVLGQALLLVAHYAYCLFDYGLANESALEASTVLERSGDTRRRGHALNYCLIACIKIGDLVRALEHSVTALALPDAANRLDLQATLLHNQAVVFEMIEDYRNALVCLKKSASLYDELPQGRPGAFFARVNAAGIYLAMAENPPLPSGAPSQAPDPNALASAYREAAAWELPPLLPGADLAATQMWLSIQARLGNMLAARQAVATCIAQARCKPSSERCKTYAMLALADYHIGCGQPTRGLLCLRRAVCRLRTAHNRSQLSTTEHRLAALYGEMGDHENALRWLRRAHYDGTRLQSGRNQVRGRFAESDREEKRLRTSSKEVQVHAQRLDVIGRLIAEIHHALAQPLGVVQARLTTLLEREELAASTDFLSTALKEVIEQIDAASALVGQLKMFSYRASPQPSEVHLQLAVNQAWKDAALWRPGPSRALAIETVHRTVVHVDAQRLAVLLRILLIEADRATAPQSPKAVIDTDNGMCCMRLSCGALQLGGGAVTVGITLCVEIAHEIGGHLVWETQVGKGLVFTLRLPPMLNG